MPNDPTRSVRVRRGWVRHIAHAAVAAAMLASIVPQLACSPAAEAATAHAAGSGFGKAVEIALPTNANSNPESGLYAAACTGRGYCVAGGSYSDTDGNDQAMVVTEAKGKWQAATELTPPTNAAAEPYFQPNGIACTAAGDCVAVGYYQTLASHDEGFIVTEAHGRWGRARQAPLPANAGPDGAGLYGVTCTGPGTCEAVGAYYTGDGVERALVISEVRGRWGSARAVTMPANAVDGAGLLAGIACTKAGDCVAVGFYDNDKSDLYDYVPVGVVESKGRWQHGVEITRPKNAAAHSSAVAGVACLPDGRCLGAGGYDTSTSSFDALAVTESHGRFGRGAEITAKPPHGTSTNLDGISCVGGRFCVGAGGYANAASNDLGFLVTWSKGRWGHASGVLLPANADTAHPRSFLYTVSCASDGYCAAVGYYLDNAGFDVPMVTAMP
jgi:hypothetical protein